MSDLLEGGGGGGLHFFTHIPVDVETAWSPVSRDFQLRS